MNVDKAIQAAITAAVQKHGQPAPLVDKLVRWFDEVISGNEDIDDEDAVYKRLDILFKTVEPAESKGDQE